VDGAWKRNTVAQTFSGSPQSVQTLAEMTLYVKLRTPVKSRAPTFGTI
jgi:hypothetical protein